MTPDTQQQPTSSQAGSVKNEAPYRGYFKTRIVWPNLLGFLALHAIGFLGGLYCMPSLHPLTIAWTIAIVFVSAMGTTIGAHRLFTHRSFKAVWGFRLVLAVLQTISGQNCLYIWVRDHRQHHKYSDTDADPHNATRGFFFSHIGWLMMRKHPDVKRMGRFIDLSDLEADPIVMFQKKYYKSLYTVFALMIPVAVPLLLWEESIVNAVVFCFFTRYTLQLNITWTVNSWAHFFGTRPYNKDIQPVESQLVSLVTLGEGWHNYHHCFPWDYRASEYGNLFDVSTAIIEAAGRFGWTYDFKTAPADMVRRRVEARGDGSHMSWGRAASTTAVELHDEQYTKRDDGYVPMMTSLSGNDNPTPDDGEWVALEQKARLRREVTSRHG